MCQNFRNNDNRHILTVSGKIIPQLPVGSLGSVYIASIPGPNKLEKEFIEKFDWNRMTTQLENLDDCGVLITTGYADGFIQVDFPETVVLEAITIKPSLGERYKFTRSSPDGSPRWRGPITTLISCLTCSGDDMDGPPPSYYVRRKNMEHNRLYGGIFQLQSEHGQFYRNLFRNSSLYYDDYDGEQSFEVNEICRSFRLLHGPEIPLNLWFGIRMMRCYTRSIKLWMILEEGRVDLVDTWFHFEDDQF
jgi:hypothetical protein